MKHNKRTDARKEYLRVLELSENVTWEGIQARYRQLVLAYHPDLNPSSTAAERFRQISAAYEVLADLNREHRHRSVEELSRMYDDPKIRQLSIEELGMRLRYSSSANVRAAAACLLGSLPGKKSRKILLQAGRDEDETVRKVVLESLGNVGQPGDLMHFLPLLNRSLAQVYFQSVGRIWARALGTLKAKVVNITAGEKSQPWEGDK